MGSGLVVRDAGSRAGVAAGLTVVGGDGGKTGFAAGGDGGGIGGDGDGGGVAAPPTCMKTSET